MKKLSSVFLIGCMLATPGWAATRTVTLSIPGMTCATCPITIRMALNRVDGVEKADVSFEKLVAVVTYDDTKASIETLITATTNAGFPSTVAVNDQ